MGWLISSLLFTAAVLADSINIEEEGLQSFISLAHNGTATDVHVQAYAPLAAGWASIGMGSKMEDSLMFVMYPSSNGQGRVFSAFTLALRTKLMCDEGVTVSPRTAAGHVMPELEPNIKLKVLNSSINADNYQMMMAEFVCYGCTTWSTGQLSTTSTSQPFIYALGPGGQTGSDDPNAAIHKHEAQGMVTGNTANAFTDTSTSPAVAPQSAAASSPAPAASSQGSSHHWEVVNGPPSRYQIWAHAVLMCLVFFLLMPLAVIFLRMPFMGRFAYPAHWVLQLMAWGAAIAALGLGINFSKHQKKYQHIDNYHQIIGVALTAVIILQAPAGLIHHLMYKKKPGRTAISYGHIVFGWMIITLGMLNGCFGLWLVHNINGVWALGVAGIVIFVAMLTASLLAGWRRRMSSMSQPVRSFQYVSSPKGSDADNKERIAYTSRSWM
ncbi:MAG: hypothetical protein Q9159_004236 [Coniocarpon cinnabarinum]